jgi:hypothetical protein
MRNNSPSAELHVRGTRLMSWLESTRSSVRQQLRRYRNELAAYEQRLGNPDVPVRQFVSDEANRQHVLVSRSWAHDTRTDRRRRALGDQ